MMRFEESNAMGSPTDPTVAVPETDDIGK